MANFLKKNIQEIIVGGLILFTYFPTVIWMWDRWFARDSYYTHGFLIPFVSVFFIWQQRKELAKLSRRTSPAGVWFMVLGIVVHVLSSFFRVYFSSGFSILLVLAGFVLHFYGKEIFKKIWFFIAFLVFMIPIPLYVITVISFQMKIFAAQIAEVVLRAMGFVAEREGSVIKMSRTYVVVDDVCSGLRSLISLMALGSVFAYFMRGPAYKRLILFAATIPIAVVTNVVRIIFLSMVADIWGARNTVGFIHDFSGFLVFAVAFILLFTVRRWLE